MNSVPAIFLFSGNYLWVSAFVLGIAGFIMFYWGFREFSEARQIVLKAEPLSKDKPSLPGAGAPPSSPEIIRLSPPHETLSPSQMSQQSRIAAALLRAGITNPGAWAAAGVERPSSLSDNRNGRASTASGAAASPAAALEQAPDKPQALLMKVNSPEMQAKVSMFGGGALILLSVYIVITHFGWL